MVSVIIPAYNVEQYIEECIWSINRQTYKDFEVVCIDDGSTDNTLKIIENLAAKVSYKLKIVSQKNAGVSAARNRGINLAKGEWICFVDADDMLYPQYLQTLVNVAQEENVQVSICGTSYIKDDSLECDVKTLPSTIRYLKKSKIEIMRDMLYHRIQIGIWDVLVKKQFLIKNNLFFDENSSYSEDLELVWKICSCAENVAIIQEQLYIYRVRDGSAMSYFNEKRISGYYLFLNLQRYLQKEQEFTEEFEKYGVAYWVWSTSWQAVRVSSNYNDYKEKMQNYNCSINMKKLKNYPNRKVSITANLFSCSPHIYFYVIKMYLKIRGKR